MNANKWIDGILSFSEVPWLAFIGLRFALVFNNTPEHMACPMLACKASNFFVCCDERKGPHWFCTGSFSADVNAAHVKSYIAAGRQ